MKPTIRVNAPAMQDGHFMFHQFPETGVPVIRPDSTTSTSRQNEIGWAKPVFGSAVEVDIEISDKYLLNMMSGSKVTFSAVGRVQRNENGIDVAWISSVVPCVHKEAT